MTVSIVICCYNSESVIRETLEAVAWQKVGEHFEWEVLLVDNNCTDRTIDIARDVATKTGLDTRLKIVQENSPGLSSARFRGIKESRFDYVAFVDDDNVLATDWLQVGFDSIQGLPEVGALGGRVVAHFVSESTTWANQSPNLLACERVPPDSVELEFRDLIAGAGIILRREALLSAFNSLERPCFILDDRKGNLQTGGGDIELCLRLRHAGWKLAFNPSMYLKHVIPAKRTTSKYLKQIVEGNVASEVFIYRMRCHVEPNKRNELTRPYFWIVFRQIVICGMHLKRTVFDKTGREIHVQNFIASVKAIKNCVLQKRQVCEVFFLIDRDFGVLKERQSIE